MAESTNDNKPNEDFSYHYPNRRSGKSESLWWEKAFYQRHDKEQCRILCEKYVANAFKQNPVIRILKEALKKAGCPINLKRHIVCEECSNKVHGGYDAEFNQIVICQNARQARNYPETILMHELIHMYDYCVNNADFTNLDHLACTEIRAANLAHCSFLSSLFLGLSSPINIKETHQYCVKLRAAKSVSVARNLEFPVAAKLVLKVFDKCYSDLEPVGRRIRKNSADPVMAYEESRCFNISPHHQ